jgi:hypothetical protein
MTCRCPYGILTGLPVTALQMDFAGRPACGASRLPHRPAARGKGRDGVLCGDTAETRRVQQFPTAALVHRNQIVGTKEQTGTVLLGSQQGLHALHQSAGQTLTALRRTDGDVLHAAHAKRLTCDADRPLHHANVPDQRAEGPNHIATGTLSEDGPSGRAAMPGTGHREYRVGSREAGAQQSANPPIERRVDGRIQRRPATRPLQTPLVNRSPCQRVIKIPIAVHWSESRRNLKEPRASARAAPPQKKNEEPRA